MIIIRPVEDSIADILRQLNELDLRGFGCDL